MQTRILVIEDNPTNMDLMCYLLRAFGYAPSMATDGAEGIECARRESPDLIICDIHLPKMDGYEVARTLKADSRFKDIPLIAVTALAMVGDDDKVLKTGFDGYISKPIDPELFIQQVEKYLKPGQRSSVTPASGADAAAVPMPAQHTRVLVLDDTPVNHELLRSTLEPSGYGVMTAFSAPEALALARSSQFDLIISDIHMPGASGLDFLRAVKADPILRTIPFIILSSSVWGEHERISAHTLGVDKFIVRPIEPTALLAEISAVLNK